MTAVTFTPDQIREIHGRLDDIMPSFFGFVAYLRQSDAKAAFPLPTVTVYNEFTAYHARYRIVEGRLHHYTADRDVWLPSGLTVDELLAGLREDGNWPALRAMIDVLEHPYREEPAP